MSTLKNTGWTPDSEKAYAFLWYMNIQDAFILSQITGRTVVQCITKAMQCPSLEKFSHEQILELITEPGTHFKHPNAIYNRAISAFYNRGSKSFEAVAQELTKEGIKSPEKIHQLWLKTYTNKKTRKHSKLIQAVLSEIAKEKVDGEHPRKSRRKIEVLLYKDHGIDVVSAILRGFSKRNQAKQLKAVVKVESI